MGWSEGGEPLGSEPYHSKGLWQLVGGIHGLGEIELDGRALARCEMMPRIGITAVRCVAVAGRSATGRWMAERRDRGEVSGAGTTI